MTTVELKRILIHKIAAINDETILSAIKTIVDKKSDATIYETTDEQKTQIKKGLDQIENGDYFTNEEVESEFTKWLKEK